MTSDELQDKVYALLFGVRRSVRYHSRRRAFFDRFNLLVNAVALIMGSTTIYGVLQTQAREIALGAAAAVTVFSAINLVVGAARQARVHHDLARRFIALEREIIAAPQPDETMLAAWTSERLEIEEEEPPKLHVLDCICHNDLMRAMGLDRKEHEQDYARIAWYQRLLAPFCDIREHAIRSGR